MFADIKKELADFDVYFDEDPSTSFSSASSTPAASQPLKNQHVTAATTDAHDATVKRPISKSLGQPNSSCPSKHSKTPSTEALDEALQPNHLEKCPKTKQASTSTKGLTNATIRDPLAPPVLEQCFDKTENVMSPKRLNLNRTVDHNREKWRKNLSPALRRVRRIPKKINLIDLNLLNLPTLFSRTLLQPFRRYRASKPKIFSTARLKPDF